MSPPLPDNPQHDFGRLLLQSQGRIYGFIHSLVPNRVDAEDILQETASVLWRKFDEFQPGSDFGAWALEVARYQVLSFRQRQKRDRLLFSNAFIDLVARDTAEEWSRLADLQEALESCLSKLSRSDLELFSRRYRSATTTQRMAAELGRPATTIYNALTRIRTGLLRCVERKLASGERD